MAKTIFEEMGGTYEMQGDYLIPCIALPPEKETKLSAYGDNGINATYSKIIGCCR